MKFERFIVLFAVVAALAGLGIRLVEGHETNINVKVYRAQVDGATYSATAPAWKPGYLLPRVLLPANVCGGQRPSDFAAFDSSGRRMDDSLLKYDAKRNAVTVPFATQTTLYVWCEGSPS